MNSAPARKNLSRLEQIFMDFVWTHPDCTAEQCRAGLADQRVFRESTVRTVLKNLENKGYVTHTVDGRTFVFRAVGTKRGATTEAARHLIDRFCGGSVRELLVGLVDDQVIKPSELRRLADEIVAARKGKKS